MHFLSFAIKRAHWRCVGTFMPVAQMYGLTPARFDLLHVVRQRLGDASQACVRRVLGVSATTVSRMLQALEKLGFVRRTPHLRDRRTKYVTLTCEGRRAVDGIIDGLLMTGHFDLAFEGCFQWPAGGRAQRTVRILFKAVRHLARKLGDRSSHMHWGEPPPCFMPWLELSPDCGRHAALGL
jgi:DNA-binding MarR family transcriptional regulator